MNFPPTVVINLPERKDRYNLFTKEFADWPVPIHRIEAIKELPGYKGCSLSHKKAIQYAQAEKFPWVVILEDDCTLEADAIRQFTKLLPFLWLFRPEWDIFLGGTANILTNDNKILWFERKQLKKVSSIHVLSKELPLFQIKGYTTMFCLIHSSSYSKILNKLNDESSLPAIDVLYSTTFRQWCTYPQLINSTIGRSNAQHTKKADYTLSFNRASKFLYNALKEEE